MSTKTWTVGRSVLFTGAALAAAVLVDQMVGCMSASAQQPSPASVHAPSVPATADDLIRQMSQSAGVIFVGTVVGLRLPAGYAGSPQDASEGVVEVDFHVERAIRGAAQDSRYTLREWAGLWAGAERYRVGQRLLVLLHATNSIGFASPVHGAEGAIPLLGVGSAPGPYDASEAPSEWMVDVRWLRAQTMRPQLRIVPPLRGPIKIHGGGNPRSEASGEPPDQTNDPLLVQAIRGPWIEQSDSAVPVETLSHVLDICTSVAGSEDVRR